MYYGEWEKKEDVLNDFRVSEQEVEGCEILFAYYTYEDYDGRAFVLFEKEGKLFEVNGSHCSCYVLEDQWEPEETLTSALLHRMVEGRSIVSDKVANDALLRVISEYLSRGK